MAVFAKSKATLKVDLPSPKDDRALTGKVGIVAVVGFVIGVAWPRLLNVKVGPDVPGSGPKPALAAAASQSATDPDLPEAPASGAAAASSSAPDGDDEGVSNKQQVTVTDGVVVSCRNKKNDKIDDCGKLAFDRTAKPRLSELNHCPAALGLEGELTVTLGINFEKNEVVVDGIKKKSEVPSSTLKGVVACAAESLKGVELEKIPHTHARYAVSYGIAFYPPGKAPKGEGEAGADGASDAGDTGLGKATVTWEKALLRDNPKEGKVVARLAQGTRVKLVEKDGDWYRVESSKGKGWVYRQAIGK